MFKGSIVALVTPFANGKVDYEKLEELIEWQIRCGTSAVVPVGTTGESPTLSHEEHREVIRFVVQKTAHRIPVIAGTGSNSTAEAVSLTQFAEKAGADAALVVVPYYNKPSQAGLYEHFRVVAASVKIPIVLYDVPARTVVSLAPDTVARLAKIANIRALKDATGSTGNVTQVLGLCDIAVLSGDDGLALPMMAVGARGVISVLANLVPEEMKKLCDLALANDFAAARPLHDRLFRLGKAIFAETNPVGIKTAMKLAGRLNGEMRLPLVPMGAENEKTLRRAMVQFGLLKE